MFSFLLSVSCQVLAQCTPFYLRNRLYTAMEREQAVVYHSGEYSEGHVAEIVEYNDLQG